MTGLAEATTGSAGVDALVAWSIGGTAVATLVTMVWRALRRISGPVEEFLEDWNGSPARPGVAARPSMMQRVGALESAVGDIKHELHPNSGSSLRDVADRIEAAVATPPPSGS
ncbi:hypothetical protein [Kitasatospora purpeofusca]|uniref:hypothetical protein n=1 Tax=Kitasatospora purpeofusca TaxID=67352 RepID=UPI00381524F2